MVDRVKKIVADVCHVCHTDITVERDLTSYGLDSARAMDLVIAIEDTFQVEIPDDLMYQFRTTNDIVQALERL